MFPTRHRRVESAGLVSAVTQVGAGGRAWFPLVVVLSTLALLPACGTGTDDSPDAGQAVQLTETTDLGADDQPAATSAEAGDTESRPNEGVTVTMARGNWSTGYMQAAIYADLLTELGYEVSHPADLELPPSNAYVAMANGEFDLWVNSWFPNHDQFLAAVMPDGSLVSDHLTTLGWEMRAGGLQGFVTNRTLVEGHGIRTLDQIVNDPGLFAIYDAADTVPGDGVLQLLGCPEGWGCHLNIEAMIEYAGWDAVEQMQVGSYDVLFAEALGRDTAGLPYVAFTWGPSSYVADLRPGDNAIWLSTSEEPISPMQGKGPSELEAGHCSADPCNLGWDTADIRVTANNDFLAAHPAAARLLELVVISPVDVALQNVAYSLGEDTDEDVHRHAAEWVVANRARVDAWLATARGDN